MPRYVARSIFPELDGDIPPMEVNIPDPPPLPERKKPNEQAAGLAARDKGMARVWEHAPEDWRKTAMHVVNQLARTQATLTADDLYATLEYAPPHPNAIGALWHEASRMGLIRFSGDTTISKRKEARGRRIPIYFSLVYST